MKDYGLFNDLISEESVSEVAPKSKSYGIFDEIASPAPVAKTPVVAPVPAPTPSPVKPTFKTFTDLTLKEKGTYGVAKAKNWYIGSLGAVGSLIETLSTGKDVVKGAISPFSTVSEELAKDTGYDKAVKALANIYTTQAEVSQDELRATKERLGINPEDTFVDQLLQGTGYLTNFVATGVPTKTLAIAVGFSKYAGAVANTLNVASESLMEAQDVYKEAKANGASDQKAYESMRNTLASNALLIGVTNKISGVFEDTAFKGIKRLMKVGASGLMEGVQEASQQMVSNYNTDKPLFQGVKDSFLIGSALGVPMAVAFDTGTKQGKEEVAKVIEQSDATPEQKQLATDILEGVATEEQKQGAVLNAITNNTFNIPVDETNKESLKEDVKQMIDQGVNTGDLVIALQAEGISQQDAENIVAEVIATPEQAVAPIEEVKVEEKVTPAQRTKEQIMEDETVPEARKKAISEIDYYLGASEAGYRAFTLESDSYDYKVVGVPSTFPQWVPENMRTRKVFDQLTPYWEKQERPSKRTPRLQALYDLFQKRVNEAEKEYQKDIDERMSIKQEDDGIEFKARKETATHEMKVLEDFKKRYKVDFPVVIVDKIIQGQKTKLSADRTAQAEGVTDGNTIAIAFDAVANTAKHELVHLTLNNLDQIPELATFSREDILKAQAEKMGEKFTENKAKDIEEQLALDFEAYQNKEYKPNNSILAKFFASIDKMLKNFRSLIVKTNGDIITQYYDAILYGETARKEEVAISTESSVTKYLIDGVLDYTPMYQTRRVLSLSNGITSVDFKSKDDKQPKFKEALDKSLEVYKESGDLTTKILKDLEGKTTVSKQYILDATNRGDVKQVEKNLIRDMLFFEGEKVNVKDFAFKVQQELLPLFVKSSDNIIPSEEQDYNPFTMNVEGGFTPKYEFVNLPAELRGNVEGYVENIYESPITTQAGAVHFNYLTKNYFGHTRVEDMAKNDLRRVIEVQSDLYQKGNLEKEEIVKAQKYIDSLTEEEKTYMYELANNPKASFWNDLSREMFAKVRPFGLSDETIYQLAKNNFNRTDVAKLAQYNDPTAHFRMIREEVRKATQDGKSVLQFPTGETAMKIEGLGGRTAWSDSENTTVTPEKLFVGNIVYQVGAPQDGWVITDVLGDGKFKAVPKNRLIKELKQEFPEISEQDVIDYINNCL